MENSPKKVLLQGAYGNGNSGDDALLLSIISDVKALIPDVDITVLSTNPKLTAQLINENIIYGRLASFQHFWNNLKAVVISDLYIFGGGGILGSMLSSLMAGLLLRSFVMRLTGGRVMIYAVGSDSIGTKWYNLFMIRAIAALVHTITVRDDVSKHYLERAGVPANKVIVTADPAFSLQPVADEQSESLLDVAKVCRSERPLVGFALTHSLSPALQDIFAQVINHLIADKKWQVILIPFEHHNDLPTAEAVAHRMKEQPIILRGRYSPAELKGIVGSFDMIISMRLHALEFAGDRGVPLVAISFAPKTDSLMQRFGQGDKIIYCGWMAKNKGLPDFTCEELLHKIDDVWNNRATIKQTIAAKLPYLRGQAKYNAELAAKLITTTKTDYGAKDANIGA